MDNSPLYSIIVATYNAHSVLKGALESILAQTYKNYELIVIDGKSTDNTVDMIRSYEKNIKYWISEKDKGIYDAWNKGIENSKGDWVMFVGADDILEPNALENYTSFLSKSAAILDLVSSQKEVVDKDLKHIRIVGWKWEWPKFLEEMTIAHPGAIHSRGLFNKYGLFDTKYKITGDYEFLLRPQNQLRAAYMKCITIKVREGGASDSFRSLKEHYNAATLTGGYSNFLARINFAKVYIKLLGKRSLRLIGINAYLKK